MKNDVCWDVTPCGSCKKRRLLQEPHGVTSQKTQFFIGLSCFSVCLESECGKIVTVTMAKHFVYSKTGEGI
jgi:hypothetical protein